MEEKWKNEKKKRFKYAWLKQCDPSNHMQEEVTIDRLSGRPYMASAHQVTAWCSKG